jgi:hypothetical protein
MEIYLHGIIGGLCPLIVRLVGSLCVWFCGGGLCPLIVGFFDDAGGLFGCLILFDVFSVGLFVLDCLVIELLFFVTVVVFVEEEEVGSFFKLVVECNGLGVERVLFDVDDIGEVDDWFARSDWATWANSLGIGRLLALSDA